MAGTFVDRYGMNRKTYQKNIEEKLGVETAIEFFTQANPDCEFAINEAEQKGIYKDIWDLVVKIPKRRTLNVEINVKKGWKPGLDDEGRNWIKHSFMEYPFCWDTMDYLWRKNSNDGKRNLPTHHLTIGGDYKRIFFNPRFNLKESSVGLKWCSNSRQKEPFYMCMLPAPNSTFYEKKRNGDWVKVISFDRKGRKI